MVSARPAHAAYWIHFFVGWTDWSVRNEAWHSVEEMASGLVLADRRCPFRWRYACVMIN